MPWETRSAFTLDRSPLHFWTDLWLRVFSPYEFNPLNLNPLRDVVQSHVDFAALREHSPLLLYLCATNVETGKVRIFSSQEICVEAVLASACLPFLFQAVEIDGQYYWDGGYVGNPAIYPLIYNCDTRDVVIVHINPIVRRGVPRTAGEILNRIDEVSFNSSLMREMRVIAFVMSLIQSGKVAPGELKAVLIHSIRSDANDGQAGCGRASSTPTGIFSVTCAIWDVRRRSAGWRPHATTSAFAQASTSTGSFYNRCFPNIHAQILLTKAVRALYFVPRR